MPFNFDFNNALGEIKEITVNPNGWKNPIIIEYCEAQAHTYDPMISICWRVKGTSHTFTIYEKRIIRHIKDGSYKTHFEDVLQKFAEDYRSWFAGKNGMQQCKWRDEYQAQYGTLIL